MMSTCFLVHGRICTLIFLGGKKHEPYCQARTAPHNGDIRVALEQLVSYYTQILEFLNPVPKAFISSVLRTKTVTTPQHTCLAQ
jgi:hypothetical protein